MQGQRLQKHKRPVGVYLTSGLTKNEILFLSYREIADTATQRLHSKELKATAFMRVLKGSYD